MQYRNLGNTSEKISAMGLGCTRMSHASEVGTMMRVSKPLFREAKNHR